jgi:hypothetical protein
MLRALYNHCVSLLCCANNMHTLLCHAPITTAHSFGSCTITRCTQFLYRALIFHMHFSLCIAPCQSSICPHHASILYVHILNYRVTTYTHIACAPTKLLCALPILHTPCMPLLCVCTPCTPSYVCALYAMPNLVCTPTHHILLRDATIYRALQHANFSARYLHANIFRAVPAR